MKMDASPVKVKSVFISLILSFVFIIILIAGGIQGIFFLAADNEWERQGNWKMALSKYAWYLSEEIGVPPQIAKAEQLAKENSIKIILLGPEINWRSELDLDIPPLPSAFEERKPRFFKHPRFPISIQRGRGQLIVRVERGDYKYIFLTEPPLMPFRDPLLVGIVLTWIAFVLFLFYWQVRRMFMPLSILQNGFESLGAGNIGYQIKQEGRHEFKFLFSSFNKMTSQLVQLWEGQRRLLRDISHELRTPLTRMKLSLALLPESVHRQELESEVNELNQIITSLLEAEKLESGIVPEQKVLDLESLLSSVLEKQQRLFPERQLIFERREDVKVLGNSNLLEIALGNIINNALKYSTQPVQIRLSRQGQRVGVQVIDQGQGISLEDQQNLFKPFFRVQSSHGIESGGFGLGLNLSSRIIRAHQGEISLVSQSQKGSTFTITLPII